MTVLRQVAVLLAAGALAALASRSLRGNPLPWRQSWSSRVLEQAAAAQLGLADLARVRAIVERQDHLLLDARPERDYLAGHLPGALSLPVLALDAHLPQVLPLLTPEQPLLVYCSGRSCDESLQLAGLLRGQGFTNLLVFAGGMGEWQAAGLAVER